jgi:hypothetical protein
LEQASELKTKKKTALQTETFQKEQKISMIKPWLVTMINYHIN